MPRVHFVKKARKAVPSADIKVGDSYYWWANRVGRSSIKRYSKTAPSRSQTTLSSFYSQLWEIQDRGWNADNPSDLESLRDDVVSDLESLKEECEENLSNMPEHLQESSVLNDRIDELDSLISDLQNVDFDYDEPDESELRQDLEERRKHANTLEDRVEPITDEEIEEERQSRLAEWIAQKSDELDGCGWEVS